MVYSTCSLNPVEDEAVIAALLEKSEGEHVCSQFLRVHSEQAAAGGRAGVHHLHACLTQCL
jgi:16S rRNA C967 or C1407 C5-methylase (RsmB/RsmF family)